MNSNDLASPSPSVQLAIVEAAVERVVRRHEATLAALRRSPRLATVESAIASNANAVATDDRDRKIAELQAEIARIEATVETAAPAFLRDELERARRALARAETTIRAQGREIERLASELERRS